MLSKRITDSASYSCISCESTIDPFISNSYLGSLLSSLDYRESSAQFLRLVFYYFMILICLFKIFNGVFWLLMLAVSGKLTLSMREGFSECPRFLVTTFTSIFKCRNIKLFRACSEETVDDRFITSVSSFFTDSTRPSISCYL